jgi:large subunit ribosomal protein L24e
MVELHNCSFCKKKIEPGSGIMHIMKDGIIYYFCSSKCRKNLLNLKRIPRKVDWVRKAKLK